MPKAYKVNKLVLITHLFYLNQKKPLKITNFAPPFESTAHISMQLISSSQTCPTLKCFFSSQQ